MTLHVGSNDVIRCFDLGAVALDDGCIERVLPALTARLTAIVEALREADPDVPILGGNYHDPLLVTWLLRGVPRDAVMRIADVWTSFNDALEATYADLGVEVADIASEFSTENFTTLVRARRHGVVPLNVARVCQWTAACGETFDPHPNTIGYAAMTRAWLAALAATTG